MATATRDKELSPEHRRFVEELLIDDNGTRAYRVCYPGCSYKKARAFASRLRKRADIKAEYEAALADRRERYKLTGEATLAELSRIAFVDPIDLVDDVGAFRNLRDIPLETRRCIQAVKVRHVRTTHRTANEATITDVESVIEYKFINKIDALGKLAAFLGLNTGLPPLDVILAALPPELGGAIRGILAASLQTANDPNRIAPAIGEHIAPSVDTPKIPE